ncbi:MAG: hypothetical protein OXF33_02110 [Rhodospirillales bacterium]|nr:hypothetical protein [Rhodospirillales bacterium]
MASWPGEWAALHWGMRTPFVRQWALGASSNEDILAFWIRASEYDEWSFEQLQQLLESLLDEEIPDSLSRWGLEVATKRRTTPNRRGPKGDRGTDFELAFEVTWRHEVDGSSLRSLYREIGDRINRSPEGVESAVKRGRKWPPGFWQGA